MTRILYVDDDHDIREIALLALELGDDIEARAAPSGVEALNIVEQWVPDIILLDLMMPQMDGPATLLKLRELAATASTPIIFVTARTQGHEAERLKSLGAAGVIAKPFDPMTFVDQVRALVSPP